MLHPESRRYLLEIVRPERGYELDFAIGTSYSLDLTTLMTLPLAFTLFGWSADENRHNVDPVVLFNSLQRYADRIALFCQAGGIYLPPLNQPLLAYLEKTVHQVAPRTQKRVFHPKVWVLRYLPVGMPNGDPRYRVICLSRNLTFDRSWDTSLVLDGALDGGTHAENQPLCDFLSALPRLMTHGAIDGTKKMRVDKMIGELPGVAFESPPGFRDLTFIPLGMGIPGSTPLDMSFDRICVVSPFLQPSILERLTRTGSKHVLISRLEALQALKPRDLAGFEQIYALSDAAVVEPEDKAEDTSAEHFALRDEDRDHLSGLHAKLFIGEVGSTVYVWTGSANATPAAFNGNVEFMVRMQGDRATAGIDAFLGLSGSQTGMVDLLEAYTPIAPIAEENMQKSMEKLLDLARQAVVGSKLRGSVVREQNQTQETYSIAISAASIALPSSVQVECWPITLPQRTALPVAQVSTVQPVVQFPNLSFEGLTTFFAFKLLTQQDHQTAEHTFVLSIPLSGLPGDREERLLQSILKDRSQFMRLLWLLLADVASEIDFGAVMGSTAQDGQWRLFGSDGPIFEAMVRALDRSPERLDAVERLVAAVRKSPDPQSLLPEQFDEIWQPIWSMRQILSAESNDETS